MQIKNNNTIPIIKINNTENITKKLSIIFDDKNNAYFVKNYGGYILKNGETTPIKINNMKYGINNVDGIDKNNNIYFSGGQGHPQSTAYILKNGETTATKISEANFSHFLDNTYYIIIDNNKNIYFSTVGNNSGDYVIKNNETEIKKITGIKGNVINSIISDSKNNSYFWTNGYFDGNPQFIKNGGVKANQILGINREVNRIIIDNKDNVYFGTYGGGAYVLKQGETTATLINGINRNSTINFITIDKDNVYFATNDGAYVLKQGETTAALIDGVNSSVYSIFVSNKKDIYIIDLVHNL